MLHVGLELLQIELPKSINAWLISLESTLCSKYFSNSKGTKEKFKGSNREVRGKIVKLLVNNDRINNQKLFEEIDEDSDKITKALEGLKKDNLIKFKKNNIIEINSN